MFRQRTEIFTDSSPEGQQKEAEVTRSVPKSTPTFGSIRQGFVYDRVPHIMLSSIANNAEIDVIWDRMQPAVEQKLAELNHSLLSTAPPFKVETGGRAGKKIEFREGGREKLPSGEEVETWKLLEWEVPREPPQGWSETSRGLLADFWDARIARQREIDASIAAKAEFEYLYDKPFSANGKTRVAGPFTVESLSPHRTLAVDWDDELIDTHEAAEGKRKAAEAPRDFTDFAHMILENLKAAGVQQAHKEDRITFTSLKGWPGNWIAAEGTFMEGDTQRRAGVFIGPEFGTVSRPDLVAAAREAGDAGFDVLICCAFNYDAHSSEFDKLGRIRVLKARMNPDLHMGGDLKSTGAGNLFVIFGEGRRGTVSMFDGPPPMVIACSDADHECRTVGKWIKDRLQEGCAPSEVGVFVRSDAELKRARAAVKAAGIRAVELNDKVEVEDGAVAISTMHFAKGLEFRSVVVMACDDDVIPQSDRIETVADDADLEEVYNTERHLLYVACTRARDHLLVTGITPVSEFVDDFLKGS